MKRFVTYIYVYEEKKKGNNVGFAKIEIRGEDCRIEIHLRGVYTKQSPCTVYFFRENTGEIEGVRIGEMRLINGSGDFGTIVKAKHINGSNFDIDNMEGIFLLTEDDNIFMSRWKEGNPLVVSKENFKEWSPLVEMEEEEQLPQDVVSAASEEGKVGEQVDSDTGTETETETLQATEIPARNLFPKYEWEEVWESLKTNRPVYRPFEDREAECIQIELKNLRELPKCYWYLGNNSFLLHGFFNYQYITIGKTGEGRWFLGVPGIYQRQERVMAAIFGFPEFLAMAHSESHVRDAEPINQFGCWCRYIEE